MEKKDISQQRSHKEGGGKKAQREKREAPRMREELGVHILRRGILSS